MSEYNSNPDLTVFAETNFRNKFRKFGIKTDDRRRHMYFIGKTGMGKSTVLENMIVNDIRAGRGVAVVDPHGDLAEKVIEFIPSNRINDVIYFNPSDLDHPIAFNVVEHVEPSMRHIVSSGLIGVFQKLWADSWGPRLEYILRNTILAVLDYPGATLLAVIRMLSDKAFRKKVIEKIQDPVVKAFWVKEFAGYADKFATEAVSPIQNKVGQFLSTALIRNIVGQVKSSIDMRDVMDNKKILIVNLSKGRIGEDNSALLGNMIITKIQLAAMSRVNIDEKTRKDFYLYVDEFQNFATDSFKNILSEARKYRLNLIMAHQYVEQLIDTVKAAVFGNVGTIITFRIGATDAEELVKEFTPTFTEEDLVNIPKYEMYCRLMIDGVMSEPFSARGLPPLGEDEKTGNVEKVIKVTRERYARSREEVEEKILRWHMSDEEEDQSRQQGRKDFDRPDRQGNGREPLRQSPPRDYNNQDNGRTSFNQPVRFDTRDQARTAERIAQPKVAAPPPPEENKPEIRENPNIYRHEAVCARCKITTRTSFEPDGIRPIFCKDCLSVIKEEKRLEAEARKQAKERELKNLEFAGARGPAVEQKPAPYRSTEEKTVPPSSLPPMDQKPVQQAEKAPPEYKEESVSLKDLLASNTVLLTKKDKPELRKKAEPSPVPRVQPSPVQAYIPRQTAPRPVQARPAQAPNHDMPRSSKEHDLKEGEEIVFE